MEMYEEMMKVQPRRHTEQQIKAERAKEREAQLQKQQQELERLRGEHKSQVSWYINMPNHEQGNFGSTAVAV